MRVQTIKQYTFLILRRAAENFKFYKHRAYYSAKWWLHEYFWLRKLRLLHIFGTRTVLWYNVDRDQERQVWILFRHGYIRKVFCCAPVAATVFTQVSALPRCRCTRLLIYGARFYHYGRFGLSSWSSAPLDCAYKFYDSTCMFIHNKYDIESRTVLTIGNCSFIDMVRQAAERHKS